MNFVLYTERRGKKQIGLRLEADGGVTYFVKGSRNQVLSTSEKRIEPAKSGRVLDAIGTHIHELPSVEAECSLAYGTGSSQPEMHSFSRHNLPPSLAAPVDALRDLLSEFEEENDRAALAIDEPEVQSEGRGIDKVEVALWGIALMGVHMLTLVLVLAVAMVGLQGFLQSIDLGIAPLILSIFGTIGIAILIVGLLYFAAGFMIARSTQNDPVATARWVAITALLIPAIFTMMNGSAPSLIAFLILPWCATAGARFALKT